MDQQITSHTSYEAQEDEVSHMWLILRRDPYAVLGYDDFGGHFTELEAKSFAFAANALVKGKALTYIDFWANDGSHPDLIYYDGPTLEE